MDDLAENKILLFEPNEIGELIGARVAFNLKIIKIAYLKCRREARAWGLRSDCTTTWKFADPVERGDALIDMRTAEICSNMHTAAVGRNESELWILRGLLNSGCEFQRRQFHRDEIARWLPAAGLRSLYAFDLTAARAKAEDEARISEIAAQAPEPTGASWTLRRPERPQGYGTPLYHLLREARRSGKTCPTARDVLDAWKTKKPPEVVEASNDELKYYDGKGNVKAINLDAIRKTIKRMTS